MTSQSSKSLVHIIVFATALTSFIRFNTVTGSTDTQYPLTKASQAFNLTSSVDSTDRLSYDISHTATSASTDSQKIGQKGKGKSKIVKKSIPALQLGEKLLVIKGYSEDSAGVLTALEKENTSLGDIYNASSSTDTTIVPTTVEVAVADDAGTVVLDQEGDITEYQVVSGDTIESIAKKYNITSETVLWANDLKKQSSITVGQKLVILPVTGVSYVIRKGDTISEISEKFHISQSELTEFNNLVDGKLSVGEVIIIPGGKILPKDDVKKPNPSKKPVKGDANTKGYFSRPIVGGVKTQGIHGHNGVDLASSYGTPILAARGGTVSLVRGGDAWNGGYGNYVVISHEKGIQTLYAHMSDIRVEQGQKVVTGQRVGSMGSTGQSTGVHLHFEVRGARNPF